MNVNHIKYLFCPGCKNNLTIHRIQEIEDPRIKTGELKCYKCDSSYPVIRFIPRFVSSENYAESFGFEWMKHSLTQYDRYWGANLSEKRFFEETKWSRDLAGECILEVGSGAGRFTEHAASTGALLITLDYSDAIEANYASNSNRNNILFAQADLYKMPFQYNSFDKLFCFGVLQHTPDVGKAFVELTRYIRVGGDLAIDVYPKHRWYKQFLKTKYWVRPITKKMSHQKLYQLTSAYINFMWPISKLIAKLPFGWQINKALLIMNYQGLYDLRENVMKEWAILDTFDMLSPAFDNPQTLDTVKRWFQEAKMDNIEVHYGYNGIEGRGRKHC